MKILRVSAAFFLAFSFPAFARQPLPALLQGLGIVQYQEHVAKLSGYADAVDGQFIPDRCSQAGAVIVRADHDNLLRPYAAGNRAFARNALYVSCSMTARS